MTYLPHPDDRHIDAYVFAADIACARCAAAGVRTMTDSPDDDLARTVRHAERLELDGAEYVETVRYLRSAAALRERGLHKVRQYNRYSGTDVYSGADNVDPEFSWGGDSDSFPQPVSYDTGASLRFSTHPRSMGEHCGTCFEVVATGWCPQCDDERDPDELISNDCGDEATACVRCIMPADRERIPDPFANPDQGTLVDGAREVTVRHLPDVDSPEWTRSEYEVIDVPRVETSGDHLYCAVLVDTFDPPRYVLRADSWEEAYEAALHALGSDYDGDQYGEESLEEAFESGVATMTDGGRLIWGDNDLRIVEFTYGGR